MSNDGPTQDQTVYDYRIGGVDRRQTLRASLGNPYNLGEGVVYGFELCLHRPGKLSYCDYAHWKA